VCLGAVGTYVGRPKGVPQSRRIASKDAASDAPRLKPKLPGSLVKKTSLDQIFSEAASLLHSSRKPHCPSGPAQEVKIPLFCRGGRKSRVCTKSKTQELGLDRIKSRRFGAQMTTSPPSSKVARGGHIFPGAPRPLHRWPRAPGLLGVISDQPAGRSTATPAGVLCAVLRLMANTSCITGRL
jgi:hypothetical protein